MLSHLERSSPSFFPATKSACCNQCQRERKVSAKTDAALYLCGVGDVLPPARGRLQARTVPEERIPEAERERAGRAGNRRAGRAGTGSWNWFRPGQTGNDGEAWRGREAAPGLGQSRARYPCPTAREGAHGAQHPAAYPRALHLATLLPRGVLKCAHFVSLLLSIFKHVSLSEESPRNVN